MKKLIQVFPYTLLAYSAMYFTIWLHELGHALAYNYFGCKNDIWNLHVPLYFANANPAPINEVKAATLAHWQQFYISLAGIAMNIILALSSWLFLNIKSIKHFRFIYFFLILFLLSHLLEAATYLTISNIIPLSDMIGVQQYNPTLRIPLFLLGLLLVFAITSLIGNAPQSWRRGMIFFSIAAALAMGGLRLLFTIINE